MPRSSHGGSSFGKGKAREGPPDHYALLEVPRDASQEDVRRSFLRLMRLNHPDKLPRTTQRREGLSNEQSGSSSPLNLHSAIPSPSTTASEDLAQRLNEAYGVLSDAELRRAYDDQLLMLDSLGLEEEKRGKREPRVSAVVDLEAFEVFQGALDKREWDKEEEEEEEERIAMRLACRCGAFYVVTPSQIEDGLDLVECSGCSLVIRIASDGGDDDGGGGGA